jgi:hypothetical protein
MAGTRSFEPLQAVQERSQLCKLNRPAVVAVKRLEEGIDVFRCCTYTKSCERTGKLFA